MYIKKNARVTFRSNRRSNFKRNNNYSGNKPRNKGNVMQLYNKYLKLAKEINLSEYCITSRATAKPFDNKKENLFQIENIAGVKVLVKKAKGKKCPRCWKITNNKCNKNMCAM